MQFINKYIQTLNLVNNSLDKKEILLFIKTLKKLRSQKGRLFILGVGGSAGNASHAVNDFRKLCEIETYTPTDNVSEITARTNDEGFEGIFSEYLRISNFQKKDAILIFSVGGGNSKKKVSVNLINAIKYVKSKNGKILSIVGRKDGYAALNSNCKIVISSNEKKMLTPISESYQAVIWHLIISHPELQLNKTKW